MLRRGPARSATDALWASHCCRVLRFRNLAFHPVRGGESVVASGGGDHKVGSGGGRCGGGGDPGSGGGDGTDDDDDRCDEDDERADGACDQLQVPTLGVLRLGQKKRSR